jgi:UDP-N-acetyl-D-glucosamine dehydrogenase
MTVTHADLKRRIVARRATVGVMGLGYVGLTEALELARSGFRVTGIDVDAGRIEAVLAGRSYLVDVADEDLGQAVADGMLEATADFDLLARMDVIVICVPTPLSKTKGPDLSYIVSAVEAIRVRLRPGQLIVLESTTYPGTTREVVLGALEPTGLAMGRDFFLCFSPERINPGDRQHPPSTIPRIVGGVTRSAPSWAPPSSGTCHRRSSRSPRPRPPRW